jgi:hypothetical protein
VGRIGGRALEPFQLLQLFADDVSLRGEDVAPQALAPEERKPIFAGIRQALKAGGLLLLRGYRPEQLAYKTGGLSQIENLYTKATLAEAFADLPISRFPGTTA